MTHGANGQHERRKGYAELKQMIDDYAWAVEQRFHRWFIISLVAFSIIGISTAIALVGFGVILKNESTQNDAIQNQRKDFVRDACEDQNQRNRDSKEALAVGSTQDIENAKTQAQKDEIARRRDVTYGIIDAVLPIQDCEALAESAVQKTEEP